jgi:O-antigen/teichoic acid export membrane protein
LLASLRHSALLRNSLALISGTVSSQLIVFLLSPLLARIFALPDFGHLANYNAWVAVLALLSSLRYEHGIIVAEGHDATERVIALTSSLTVISVLLYAIIAAALHFAYSGGGYLGDLRQVALFIPVGVLVLCTYSLLAQIATKAGEFKRLALAGAVQVIGTVAPQIALGVLHVAHGLIIGTIIGYVASCLVLAPWFARRHRVRDLRRHVHPAGMRATAAEHGNLPRYAMPADAVTLVAQQFVPVFVMAMFNPALSGLYAFSTRVVRTPLLVVSAAVAGALRKEAMDHAQSGRSLQPLFANTVRALFVVGLVPFVALVAAGPAIFALVFGPQWREAGHVVQILSPGLLLELVAFPLSAFFLMTRTQHYTLRVQAAGFVALVAAIYVGRHYLNDFASTAYLISLVLVGINLTSIVLARRVSRTPDVYLRDMPEPLVVETPA